MKRRHHYPCRVSHLEGDPSTRVRGSEYHMILVTVTGAMEAKFSVPKDKVPLIGEHVNITVEFQDEREKS